jgi:hypothetical protein
VTVPVWKSFAATLLVGCALAVGCSSRNLPVKPATGGAGVSGHAGAGSAGSSTSGSTGAAGGAVTGLAGGTAGASVGGAGSTGGSGGVGGAAGFKGILGEGGSDGGAPDCKDPCPALTCASGSAPMPDPLQCCPICKSVKCAEITCPAQSCLPGHHPDLGSSQCCLTCVVDPNVCEEAVAEFTQLVGSLRDQLGGPCQSDGDCTYTSWNNGCSGNCFVPVTKAGAAMFDAQLQDATTTCNTICGTPQPISCPHMTAVCAQGRCAAKP